jgi:hypothetical protein
VCAFDCTVEIKVPREGRRVTEEDGSVSRISLKREANDIHTSFEPHPSSHVLRKTVPPTVTKHKKTGKAVGGVLRDRSAEGGGGENENDEEKTRRIRRQQTGSSWLTCYWNLKF